MFKWCPIMFQILSTVQAVWGKQIGGIAESPQTACTREKYLFVVLNTRHYHANLSLAILTAYKMLIIAQDNLY